MSNDVSSGTLPTWATVGIVAMITSLAGGIVGMFKLMRSDAVAQLASHEKDIEEIKKQAVSDRETLQQEVSALQIETRECRKDREELRIALGILEAKVNTNKSISDANHKSDKV